MNTVDHVVLIYKLYTAIAATTSTINSIRQRLKSTEPSFEEDRSNEDWIILTSPGGIIFKEKKS